MKSKASFVISLIFSAALTVGLLMCLATSFDISLNLPVLIISAAIFSSIISLLSEFINSRVKYLAALAVIQVVFIMTLFMSLDRILNELEYAINKILAVYSQYLSVPSSIDLTFGLSDAAKNATVLFVFLAFIVSELISISLVRVRRIILAVVVSLIILLPCFLMVNTPPSIVPLVCVLSILFALYITAFIRRKSNKSGAFSSALAALLMAVVITVISILCPLEGFERFEWQETLLDYANGITGIGGSGTQNNTLLAVLGQSKSNIKEREALDSLEDFVQTATKIMEVKAETSGKMYLKGVAYAEYENNEWSILSDEEALSYPVDFEVTTLTKSESDSFRIVHIKTENIENIIFVPYYPTSSFNYIEVGDVFVKNNSRLKSYSTNYYPYLNSSDLYRKEGSRAKEYKDFVYDTYTKLPDDTKESMLEISEKNGIDSLSDDEKIKAVKNLVSSSAEYSLTPAKMPKGEDFAVWFLESADSGYCVHFATAATVMLRALGIPARYVTGYSLTTKAGTSVTVTSDDAHAWVEYYDDSIGWVPLEVTPSAANTQANGNTQASTTESTTSATVKPTEPSTNANNTDNTQNKKSSGKLDLPPVFIIVSAVLLIILFILLRMLIISKARQTKFTKGKNNSRSIYLYRYILRLTEITNNVIPDEITDIANKAKFSNHAISVSEVRRLKKFAEEERAEMYKNRSNLKGLYYRFIKVL